MGGDAKRARGLANKGMDGDAKRARGLANKGMDGDAKRASRYLLRKHVRSHGFSTYADFCRLPQTRTYGAQTVLQRQS